MHAGSWKKDILITFKGPTDGLHEAPITAEAECSINFSEQ